MDKFSCPMFVRLLGVAWFSAALGGAANVASAAMAGPTQPSSYGAQPESQEDAANEGDWKWVMTSSTTPPPNIRPTGGSLAWVINDWPFGQNGSGSTESSGADSVGSATVTVAGQGTGGSTFHFNTITWQIGGSAVDSYTAVWTREWVDGDGDPGTPVKATATATASGTAALTVKDTAGAYQASYASGSASASGACSAFGTQIGNMADQTIGNTAQYTTVSNTLGISGNVGPAGLVNAGKNVTGSIQANEGFTASGAGVANSTSTFSMAGSTSVDSASTGLTISESGVANASNGGEGQEPGYATVYATISVTFSDAPG